MNKKVRWIHKYSAFSSAIYCSLCHSNIIVTEINHQAYIKVHRNIDTIAHVRTLMRMVDAMMTMFKDTRQ